ncbi:MAG: DUF1553 domain-containing protein [Planctomycetaceae bacterium]
MRPVVLLGVVCFGGLFPQWSARGAEVDFDSQVAPLLAKACLGCHNANERRGGLDLTSRAGALQGGDSGAALDVEHPAESLLLARVVAGEMPPRKPLDTTDRELLSKWLVSGGKWGTDTIDPLRYTSEVRAGYDWWSLTPVRRPTPPQVADVPVVNPIDQFVAAARQAKGLPHSAEADRRTLVRRVWFDLLGLPPSPEEIEAFLADPAPNAWSELVEQLLQRSEYGERWGRHWLDLARFGESQGFERDKLRTNSWPYRDWVVWAFNHDLPYDEFIRLQVAGDVLRPDDPRAVIATGFLVAAPWDEVGQSQQSQAMRMVVRQDELEDVIGTTAQTFLGLTANCARCHDHKFDPISQREYYRLAAALAGVRHGEREALSEAGRQHWAAEIQRLETELSASGRALDAFDRPHRSTILDARERGLEKREAPRPVSRWEVTTDLRDSLGELHGTPHGAARVERGRLILDGSAETWVETVPLQRELREKTLAVWVALSDLKQQGGAAFSVQTPSGAVFDAIVYGEREPGQWMAGSNGFVRTQSFRAPVETVAAADLASGNTVQITLVYRADQTIAMYRNGVRYGEPYNSGGLATYESGKAQVLFGLRHSPPGGNRMFAGAIDRAELFDRALSEEEVADLNGTVSQAVSDDEIVARLSAPERVERNRLVRQFSETQLQLNLLRGGVVYSVKPSPPGPTHLLDRGNPAAPRELVSPGAFRAVASLQADFDLADDAPDADRRRRLAEWLSSPRNPLTARVIVNRLWHHHFGVGLVDTPNDLGFNGGRPSHPELLDWLAAELVEPSLGPVAQRIPWSLKHIHRLILNSATWRQSSRRNPNAERIDSGNRLLWRKTPQRLDAESVRDAILAVSGELNPSLGGPGFRDFRTFNFNSQFYEMIDPVGYDFHRRTLYRTWVRSGRSDFLDAFDCPDPSTTAPRRAVTTTPLQALAMLNNSFTLRMAERLAQRVEAEVGQDPNRQAERACQLSWGRLPSVSERQVSSEFLSEFGLSALCRLLFNSNEFLYVD